MFGLAKRMFVIASICVQLYCVDVYIPSASMSNTLIVGDHVLCLKTGDVTYQYERGDIIVFESPIDKSIYIKRIIGLPGEKVEIQENKVWINDSVLEEKYVSRTPAENEESYIFYVPKDSYLVLGDNRGDSFDSRYWYLEKVKTDSDVDYDKVTFVERKNIIAVAMMKIHPTIRFLK